jgi:hypothetical protein
VFVLGPATCRAQHSQGFMVMGCGGLDPRKAVAWDRYQLPVRCVGSVGAS